MSNSPECTPKKISRRSALRKIIVGSITSLFLGGIIARELKHEADILREKRFETDEAIFYPFYERHDQRERVLSPEKFPKDIDVISMEGSGITVELQKNIEGNLIPVSQSVFDVEIHSLLLRTLKALDTYSRSDHFFIPLETLDYLRDYGILIAVGDLKYSEDNPDNFFESDIGQMLKLREEIGNFFKEFGIYLGALEIARKRSLDKATISKRSFLRTSAIGSLMLGVSLSAPVSLRNKIHQGLMDSIQDNNPYQRIWARVSTINSNMMPEFLNSMFREMVQANKLIVLANNLKKIKGKKPNIGYNWHLGHRGIEDWLRVNQTIIRSSILAYPNHVLQKVIAANNNDSRHLYAIRVVGVPDNYRIISSNSSEFSFEYDGNETGVFDEMYEDAVLKEQLKKRGLA